MSERKHDVGSELRRGVIATALGAGLGALVALLAKRDRTDDQVRANPSTKGRRWRGRSAT